MYITNINVENFRSFEKLNLELGKFNVLIGANASGKSNFISIFIFLKNLIEYGIEDAISLSGGIEYLKNLYQIDSNFVRLEIHVELGEEGRGHGYYETKNNLMLGYDVNSFEYKLDIEVKNDIKYEVVKEYLLLNIEFKLEEFEISEEEYDDDEEYDDLNTINEFEGEFVGHGKIIVKRSRDDIRVELDVLDSTIDKNTILTTLIPERKKKFKVKHNESLFNQISLSISVDLYQVEDALSGITSYNINPLPLKQFSTIAGKSELEPDGNNLILILKRILNDRKEREKLSEIIKELLPFIEDLSVEKFTNKYIYGTIKEVFSDNKTIPSFLFSDGTINVIALIIILFFEKKPIVIIEEPERNVHPYLISKIIDLAKDVSSRLNKQVIITTHNPEIVKYAGIENLLLIHRDVNGFSNITKPSMSKEVKNFLKNDLGLDELFIQNLLK